MKHLHEDITLTQILGIKQIPKASALGNWLRSMGNSAEGMPSLTELNSRVLNTALHHHKGITLDTDATEIISHKADAVWKSKK